MNVFDYTTVIEPAEPLAGRRGSAFVVRQQLHAMLGVQFNTVKQFSTILLLTSVLFVNSKAQATDTLRASPGSLEIVLNLQEKFTYGKNTDYYNVVAFSAAKNITMGVTFRNVGEVNIEQIGRAHV